LNSGADAKLAGQLISHLSIELALVQQKIISAKANSVPMHLLEQRVKILSDRNKVLRISGRA
jgi:hypothetical protein